MNLTFRPLVAWPQAFTKNRRNSQFSAKYLDTLDLLTRELESISARSVVIQMALEARDIRRDGFPRTDARPGHPGVLLAFELKDRAVSMPCDTFLSWQDNLRALALSLEALRKVNRYGVTQNGEQYRGWEALPPASSTNDFSTREEALLWLARVSGNSSAYLVSDPKEREAAYKAARAKLHPDAPTGSHEEFLKIEAAKRLIEGTK